ncbi:MAG: hypothetical protein ABIV48_03050 [Pyrinomonadaceae bacterium]
MAINEQFDWRRSDRKLFLAVAIAFPIITLIGFGRTYYFKMFADTPPLSSLLVHVHGLVMSAWVAFFIVQVWLIRNRNVKVHMRLGMAGISLATLLVIVGFFTAAASAKFGSPSTPPGFPPLAFFAVPLFDLVMFVILFGGAIYYRLNAANHKRLMLLTVLNFLPPALARIPLQTLQSLGPLIFFGVPALLTIGLVAWDTRRNRKLNLTFLAGSIALILSYPLRMILSGTDTWMGFAVWITSWAA